MDSDAISGFQSGKISQESRHFIYPVIKLLVGDGNRRNVFRLPHKDKRRFVPVLLQVTVNTVIRGVELASGIPLPERSITGIERGVPILVPAQQVCIFTETF